MEAALNLDVEAARLMKKGALAGERSRTTE